MLQLQNISKTYPVGGQKFQALCQVSFHVEEGDFIRFRENQGLENQRCFILWAAWMTTIAGII